MEIERKWLISRLPKATPDRTFILHQAYLYADDNVEVRLTIKYDTASYNSMERQVIYRRLTIKKGNGYYRQEQEFDLTEDQMEKIRPWVGAFIVKHYYFYEQYGYYFQISEVNRDGANSFKYMEVEFSSPRRAFEFNIFNYPAFGEIVEKEVTDNDYYQMKNYWRRNYMKPSTDTIPHHAFSIKNCEVYYSPQGLCLELYFRDRLPPLMISGVEVCSEELKDLSNLELRKELHNKLRVYVNNAEHFHICHDPAWKTLLFFDSQSGKTIFRLKYAFGLGLKSVPLVEE